MFVRQFGSSLFISICFWISVASAAEVDTSSEVVRKPSLSHGQFLNLMAGAFQPSSIELKNLDYTYRYDDDSKSSFVVEISRDFRLFKTLGQAFYINLSFNYSLLRMRLPSDYPGNLGRQSLNLNLFGMAARVEDSWENFPWKRLVPFLDGGFQYTYYSQSGLSDIETVDGGVGNFVLGGGLRFWMNPSTSLESKVDFSLPVFLLAKVNHMFGTDSALNLESTSFLGGLTMEF
ncbi:MAG: hypothetical protein JWQ35_2664 [Bacteriovoracaceae bacterium]|nr:hypothetical protein [Bacteriovoracaceae bacterium]